MKAELTYKGIIRNWKKEEIDYLISNYKIKPYKEIAKKLNRSIWGVYIKSNRLGLKRMPYYSKKGKDNPNFKNKLISHLCLFCGKKFKARECDNRIYCCKNCFDKSISGENSPNWKGGITPLEKQIRHSKKYNKWRKAVLERDNHTCKLCGEKGITAHHIIPFEYVSTRFELNNGLTLCKSCHNKIHKGVEK